MAKSMSISYDYRELMTNKIRRAGPEQTGTDAALELEAPERDSEDASQVGVSLGTDGALHRFQHTFRGYPSVGRG